MGQHTAARRMRPRLWTSVAVVIVLAAAGIVIGIWRSDSAHDTHRAAPGDSPSASPDRRNCPQLNVLVPPGLQKAITSTAQFFSGCAKIVVAQTPTASAPSAALKSGTPTIWIAEDSLAISSLPASITPSAKPVTIASSPVVAAFPPAAAAALATSTNPPALDAAVLRKVLLAGSWRAAGQSSWGRLQLVAPDPTQPGAGAAAISALSYLAYGGVPQQMNYAKPSQSDLALVRGIQAVSKTANTDTGVFGAASGAGTGYLTTAVAAAANPGTHVLAMAPGLSVAYQAVGFATTGTSAQATAARSFLSYLSSAFGAKALRSAGLGPAQALLVPTASLGALIQEWKLANQPISTTLLIDASGSMADPLAGTNTPKITLVQQAAGAMVGLQNPTTRSAFWYFQSGPPPAQSPIITVGPLLAADAPVGGGMTHAQQVIAQLSQLKPSGGTPLYQAILQGYSSAERYYQPGQTNLLVVLTDGQNEDTSSPLTLTQLTAQLASKRSAKTPIRMVLVGLGADADIASLSAIAQATGGAVVRANSFSALPNVLTQMLS